MYVWSQDQYCHFWKLCNGSSKSQEIQQNTNEELKWSVTSNLSNNFDNKFDEDNIYEEISNIPNQPTIKNDDNGYYTTTDFKFTRISRLSSSINFAISNKHSWLNENFDSRSSESSEIPRVP